VAQLGGVSADPASLGTGVVNCCGPVPVFVDLFGASGGLAAGASGGLIFGI
jgi:hypothetical protein